MKANRKFLNDRDDAVSPVIAVILMVAITVVLAATVYVWVSGFGAQSSAPAKAVAMTSAGAISQEDLWDTTAGPPAAPGTDGTDDYYQKSYTVSSASPGMKYSDMSFSIAGTPMTFESTNCAPTAEDPADANAVRSKWSACSAAARASTDLVSAGDTIILQHHESLSGKTLRIIDPNSNSVMLTLTVS